MILLSRETVDAIGWGFQLQNPVFVTFMIYLFFILGLNLLGIFEMGGAWTGFGQSLTQGNHTSASFFTGILAALVASPCTAPFMATAMSVAITQPLLIGLTIFISLGFGMALPFLLLSYSPKLARALPSPGSWMTSLKEFFSFPMFATTLWLFWILGHQTNSDGVVLILSSLLINTFVFWLTNKRPKSISLQALKLILIFCSIVCTLYLAIITPNITKNRDTHWQPYSSQALEKYRINGQAVFVDLTADWCITCKVNESTTLNTEEIIHFAQSRNIVMMQGDFTNHNDDIAALLKSFNRSGVPLYLMYAPGKLGDVEVLPQILTKSFVIESMKKATAKSD